jgi:hypothetical protein
MFSACAPIAYRTPAPAKPCGFALIEPFKGRNRPGFGRPGAGFDFE